MCKMQNSKRSLPSCASYREVLKLISGSTGLVLLSGWWGVWPRCGHLWTGDWQSHKNLKQV